MTNRYIGNSEGGVTFESGAAAVSCAIVGTALFGYGLHLRSKLRSCQSWPQTTGIITESGLNTDDGYEIRVIYEYTVNGVGYSGRRVQFGTGTSYTRKSRAELTLSRYPANAHLTVYYDAENPAEAVLDRTSPGGLEYIIIGIIMLVMMALVMMYPANGSAPANP